jgi:hypothetical protein
MLDGFAALHFRLGVIAGFTYANGKINNFIATRMLAVAFEAEVEYESE